MSEEWLSAGQAAEHVGVRRRGRPTHPLTIRSWWNRGLRGVVLRSELRGGVRCTTAAWLEEFFRAVAQVKPVAAVDVPAPAALARRRAASARRRAKLGID